MSLTYTQYVNSLANLLVVAAADAGFQSVLPNIIDDAEQRIYRELDLLNTSVSGTSTLTAGSRNLTVPTFALGAFEVAEEANVITPAGTTNPELGTRNPMVPVSQEYLNYLWPSVTGSTVPQNFALTSSSTIIVGPWPAAAYTVEVVGTIRPDALSTSNVTTLLSVYFPDLLVAASMVFAAGYQKNFGAGVDDPKAAVTWESHFQALLPSAKTEEARKKFTGPAWSPKDPAPLVTPPRT